ncbi:MAG: hypothetical protein EOM52_07190 [Clostridia bacterium]|nr:hypothetical protein [Clostridia bacterium]
MSDLRCGVRGPLMTKRVRRALKVTPSEEWTSAPWSDAVGYLHCAFETQDGHTVVDGFFRENMNPQANCLRIFLHFFAIHFCSLVV